MSRMCATIRSRDMAGVSGAVLAVACALLAGCRSVEVPDGADGPLEAVNESLEAVNGLLGAVNDLLGAVNGAVEAAGANYLPTPVTFDFDGARFDGVSVGDFSTWEVWRCPTLQGGLSNFTVELSLGLRPLRFTVASFTVGPYAGPLALTVLQNSIAVRFEVADRFGPSCRATVVSLELEDFDEPRIFADDPLLPADFHREKFFVLGHFGAVFFNNDSMGELQKSVGNILDAYFCHGMDGLISYLNLIF